MLYFGLVPFDTIRHEQVTWLSLLRSLIWTMFGFPGRASGKEPACPCRRHKRCRLDPWVGKIPWRKAWQPTPVFLPGESPWAEKSGGLQSMGSQRVGYDWSDWAHMHQEIGCSLFSRIAKFHLCYYMETIHLITRPTWKKTVFLTA